jgi:hypothetical protein
MSPEGDAVLVDDAEYAGRVEGDEEVVDAKENGSGNHADGDREAAAVGEFMESTFAEFVGPHLEVIDSEEFGVDAVFVDAVPVVDGDDEELIFAVGAEGGDSIFMTHGCLFLARRVLNSITVEKYNTYDGKTRSPVSQRSYEALI